MGTIRRIYSASRIAVEEGELERAVEKHAWENVPGKERGSSTAKPTPRGLDGGSHPGREELIETARADFPEGHFERLGSDLIPYDDGSLALVFSVSVMHYHPASAKRTPLSEMWRVARPGGRLLFLENFVFTGRSEDLAIHPMSVTEFVDLILDATAGQVVLEHAESLRYPGEDLYTAGLISLSRLGAQQRY